MCFYDGVVCSRASNGWTHCCNFTWLIINSAWLKSDAHMHPMHKWPTPIGIILYSDRLAQLALSVRPRIIKNLNSKMRLIELILHEYKRIPIGPAIYPFCLLQWVLQITLYITLKLFISQSQEGSMFIFRFTAPHGRARNTELRVDSPSICKPNFWKSYRWKLGNQGEQKSPKFWQHREQIMCVQTGTWKKHMKSMSVINLSV